jgi:hypothetical protein
MFAGIYLLLLIPIAPIVGVMFIVLRGVVGASPLGEPDVMHVPITDWEPFARRADGMIETFAPAILGAAAPLGTLSGLADATLPRPVVAAAALVYAASWVLLWGGVLARYGGGPSGWQAFTRAAVRFAVPIARLTAVALLGYVVIFVLVRTVVYDGLLRGLLAVVDERTALAMRAAGTVALALALACCAVLVDYARIEIVLRGRERVREAVAAAWQLLRRCALAVAVLAVLGTLLFAGTLAAYAAFDLGTRGATDPWLAVLVGQACTVVEYRMFVRTKQIVSGT